VIRQYGIYDRAGETIDRSNRLSSSISIRLAYLPFSACELHVEYKTRKCLQGLSSKVELKRNASQQDRKALESKRSIYETALLSHKDISLDISLRVRQVLVLVLLITFYSQRDTQSGTKRSNGRKECQERALGSIVTWVDCRRNDRKSDAKYWPGPHCHICHGEAGGLDQWHQRDDQIEIGHDCEHAARDVIPEVCVCCCSGVWAVPGGGEADCEMHECPDHGYQDHGN
jgi:hypothetical protein